MNRKALFYNLFFPENKNVSFKKLRWTIMIIIQELSMCKYKSVAKYFYKKSYHKNINTLRDILSKERLFSTDVEIALDKIQFSHEINYPNWVIKLINDLRDSNGENYQKIKIFFHNGQYLVIDGNHRLKALKDYYDSNNISHENVKIKARLLRYVSQRENKTEFPNINYNG